MSTHNATPAKTISYQQAILSDPRARMVATDFNSPHLRTVATSRTEGTVSIRFSPREPVSNSSNISTK
jgi:hypothetical protein